MATAQCCQTTAPDAGLLVIAHETQSESLRYTDWGDFAAFARHKDFPDIKDRHNARGLPDSGFVERYTRHAKALVAVGSGQGQDRRLGLETEIVALANPYTDDLADGLPIAVFLQVSPAPMRRLRSLNAQRTVLLSSLCIAPMRRVTPGSRSIRGILICWMPSPYCPFLDLTGRSGIHFGLL